MIIGTHSIPCSFVISISVAEVLRSSRSRVIVATLVTTGATSKPGTVVNIKTSFGLTGHALRPRQRMAQILNMDAAVVVRILLLLAVPITLQIAGCTNVDAWHLPMTLLLHDIWLGQVISEMAEAKK